MKRLWTTLFVFVLTVSAAWATHNRAGYLTYERVSNLTYRVTVVLYTYTGSSVNRDSIPIIWGDGSPTEQIPRVAISISPPLQVQFNEYSQLHTFPGPGVYKIQVEDPNRKGNSVNIPSSDGFAFYIEGELNLKISSNNSAYPTIPVVAYANRGDTFTYNPTMFDIDGDSLVYELHPVKGNGGMNVPGYLYPDEVAGNGPFTLDSLTGEIRWIVPQAIGEYNVAVKVLEYAYGLPIPSGHTWLDIQIIVLNEPNDPPDVKPVADICVVAGDVITDTIYATDPDSDVVTLYGAGGPFRVASSPATFPTTAGLASTSSIFNWNTNCSHIRRQFYEVVFTAEDDYIDSKGDARPLIDVETYLITVIAPAPTGLTGNVNTASQVELTWDSLYNCSSNPNFKGFSIWRSVGSNTFTPGYCETGLAGRGYTRIAKRVKDYHFVDAGLNAGALYCYRILAEFTDGAVSIPSNETCVELSRDVPVITNVDVVTTDAVNGQIDIAWTKPRADDLDTVQNAGPYEFRLYRAANDNGSSAVVVHTASANNFYQLNDTTHSDVGLNTAGSVYSYYVEFYVNGGTLLGQTAVASSIFVNIAPDDRSLILSWNEKVPWFNNQYQIYGRPNTIGGVYNPLGIATGNSFSDTGLVNGDDYCYYVLATGTYGVGGSMPDPLLNRSQRICGIPKDTVPPCPPVLTVTNYCGVKPEGKWSDISMENGLNWTNPETIGCADDVAGYNIYYTPTLYEPAVLLATTSSATDTFYDHVTPNSFAGCYTVTAVDVWGNESEGNRICVDNCPFYELPNVFTPNGDNFNDLFTPILPYRFVERIDIQIFNRWGQMVFRTEDPDINWDGKVQSSGEEAKEGYYFYVCDVYTTRLEGEERVRLNEGFIRILR